MKKPVNAKRFSVLLKGLMLAAMFGLLASCRPYGSVEVGAPFKVGPVYVNPKIGVGGFL